MKIEAKKVVSLTYQLKTNNGNIVDTATNDRPFTFIHGIGHTLAEFDRNLIDLAVGDSFKFEIKAADGYGTKKSDFIVDIPKAVFEAPEVPKDILKVGNMVPMQDNHGNPMNGIIKNIGETEVTVDFNHPLADEDLFFEGNILEIRNATEDELAHGHVHGPGGHHH